MYLLKKDFFKKFDKGTARVILNILSDLRLLSGNRSLKSFSLKFSKNPKKAFDLVDRRFISKLL